MLTQQSMDNDWDSLLDVWNGTMLTQQSMDHDWDGLLDVWNGTITNTTEHGQ